MRIVRHFCAILGLLSVLNLSASDAPYPEVFDEFITGWVDYDDGYYAAALRAFARAHALDPEFRPATEAMAASLGHMGMPEIGESILRDRWVSKGRAYTFRPAIAFWGIFHSSEIDSVSTAGLERTVTEAMNNLVDLPIVLTSPSAKTWTERKNQQPCAYNLLIFLFQEDDAEYAIARVHLIRNYNVESGKELDVAFSTTPNQLAHRKIEIKLDPDDVAQLSGNRAFNEGLRELLDPDLEIENPAYRIDAETEASLSAESTEDPWMLLSKASSSAEFALEQFPFIENLGRQKNQSNAVRAALAAGFPEWLAHQLDVEHPMRPWLLAEARHENYNSLRWHPKKAGEVREELLRDHPEHPALVAIQLAREAWGLHHLNYQEKIPQILPHLEKLKRLPPERFHRPRDFEYLQRFDKTIRACLGEPFDEPFMPCLISRANLRMSDNGTFRLSFNGSAPKLSDEEVQTISDPSKFAEEVLIGKMWAITDAKLLLATYKENLLRDDPLGTFLRGGANSILHRIRSSGDKETYKEACEWWVQLGADLIDSDASWARVTRIIPSHYLPYEDYNRPLLRAMNRRLEEKGLPQGDDNAVLAFKCAITWKISFLDLSAKSQEAVIQHYRERAAVDFRDYLRLLAWLNWSGAKRQLQAEVLRTQEININHLNAESNPRYRADLAHNYAQLLIAAGESQIALDVCAYALPDAEKAQASKSEIDLERLYALGVIQAKALVEAGRLDEASQVIDQLLREIGGQYYRYKEYYIYDFSPGPKNNSLSSTLLKLRGEIEQKK